MTSFPPSPSGATDDHQGASGPSLSGGVQAAAFVGLLGLAVSIFLTWGTESMWGEDRSAVNLTSQFLWDTTPADLESSPIMWLLVVAGLVAMVGLWRREVRFLVVVGGLGVLAVPLLYLRAVDNILSDPMYLIDGGLTSHIGIGVWLCAVAGVALTAAGAGALLRPNR